MLVTYCRITNDPNTSWLKTTHIAISLFLWVRSPGVAQWGASSSGSLVRQLLRCWLELQPFPGLDWRGFTSKLSLWLLAGHRFLPLVGQRYHFLATWVSAYSGQLLSRQSSWILPELVIQEGDTERMIWKLQSLYSLTLELTSHQVHSVH